MKLCLAALVLAPLLVAMQCHPQPTPPPALDAGTGGSAGATFDAGPVPPVWDSLEPCRSAVARMLWVECVPVGPDSGLWIDACELGRANGLSFGVPCLRDIETRADVALCGVTCRCLT